MTDTFEYDAFGRRTHRFLPGANLNDTTANTGMENTSYSYVGAGNPVKYTLKQTVRNFKNQVITTDYNSAGRVAKRVVPASGAAPLRTAVYTYQSFGGVSTVAETASGVTRTQYYNYETLDRMTSKDVPEGVLAYAYNEMGAVTSLKAYRRASVGVNALPGAAVPDVNPSYIYDGLNRIQTMANLVIEPTTVTTYAYDNVTNHIPPQAKTSAPSVPFRFLSMAKKYLNFLRTLDTLCPMAPATIFAI